MAIISVTGKCKTEYKSLASLVSETVFDLMNFPKELEVEIKFVSEKEIQRLNKEFRGIDRVTDVLSFPAFNLNAGEVINLSDESVLVFKEDNGYIHFGDMAICLKQAERQAKEYGVGLMDEIKKLVIHSVLHLMGYDHIKDEDYLVMKKQEEKLDKLI